MEPEQLDAWRAFLSAHAQVTRAIGRDLAAAGLPDLGWYDLLWTLYRALQVALTEEGVELLRRMWPVYERGIERHFAAQLDRSPQRLRAMLERMAASAREA